MRQTKLESSLEATVNIASGFVVSFCVWIFVIPPIFGQAVNPSDAHMAFWITSVFTVSSWLRSYLWRRFFNAGVHRTIHNLARRFYGR